MDIKRVFALVTSMALVCIMLSAFVDPPTVRLLSEEFDAEVSYLGAKKADNKLSLTIEFDTNGDYFEIAKDVVVATDSDFTNTLRPSNLIYENGKFTYEYPYEGDVDSVFIMPPVLFMSTDFPPISASLSEGTQFKSPSQTGQNWFKITTIDINEERTGIYRVGIQIVPSNNEITELPRFPKLVIGNEVIGGINNLKFDEENNFCSGYFIFYILADNQNQALSLLNSAYLSVSNALVTVEAQNTLFSPKIKSIDVVNE